MIALRSVAWSSLLLATAWLPVPANAADAVAVRALPALSIAHAETGLLLGVAKAGKRMIAVGGNGTIVASDDGNRWKQVPSPVDVTLTGVSFADERNGWAVGHDAAILHTSDGGLHWTIQNLQPDLNSPMFAVLALSAQQVIAVGAFGTLKFTSDGGKTWVDLVPPEVVDEKLHLNAVARLTGGDLMVVGERGLVAHSVDGQNWQRLKTPYEGSFFGVLPWGSKGAVAFGMRGNVYAIDDVQNAQWRKIEAATTGSFFSGHVSDDKAVILVGADGQIVRLDAAGNARSLPKPTAAGTRLGSLAGSTDIGKALLVVGDSGVTRVPLP